VDRHEKSLLELAAAQASREDARATVLALDRSEIANAGIKESCRRFAETEVPIEQGVALPSEIPFASESELVADLRTDGWIWWPSSGIKARNKRCELRVAQFPKIGLGLVAAAIRPTFIQPDSGSRSTSYLRSESRKHRHRKRRLPETVEEYAALYLSALDIATAVAISITSTARSQRPKWLCRSSASG